MDFDKNQTPISKEQWKNIIEEQKQFRGSARAFCQLHQINLRAFYFYRSKFKEQKLIEQNIQKKSSQTIKSNQPTRPPKAARFAELRAIAFNAPDISSLARESTIVNKTDQIKSEYSPIRMPDPIWLAHFLKELIK